ncbi:MAG: hypothetical protein Q8N18_20660 [Opitutaceae bacterium]|nr:hypothetical protein [Opitutaceae bacterium]
MPSAGPTDALRETPRFAVFIDRNSGGRLFKALIERAGIEVHLHDDHFSHKTEDPDWLAQLGESGWLLVSGDNDVTRQPLFLHQLSHSKAHVFVMLALNGACPEGKAGCIAQAHARMCELAARTAPPALWRIGKDGVARAFDFRATLERMKRGRKI